MTWFWTFLFAVGLVFNAINAFGASMAENYSKATYFLIWSILFAYFLKESVDDVRRERGEE